MKKLLLTGIAALFLATSPTYAEPDATKEWQIRKLCNVYKLFNPRVVTYGLSPDEPVPGDFFGDHEEIRVYNGQAEISLQLDDLLELQKLLPYIKKCEAFWTCVAERDGDVKPKGKRPKHCYENDRRWR
jgi:hypothetical protein